MTLTLELPEELERQLREVAQEQQLSPEDMALITLKEALQHASHRQKVKAAGDYVQKKNAELYRRLA